MEDNAKKRTGVRSATSSGTQAKPVKARAKPSRAKAALVDLETVQITVADSYLGRFDDVVGRVKKLGLETDHELPETGVIIGRIPMERVKDLGQVEGVEYFERSGRIALPPPDSDVQ